ncbi:methyltransferase domain-containing protein [candidate division KSB1 bacterium]|nr:methyltransferase domain-containing protein [candidate division KSB1 bacterium]RQW07002.1 MAG: methyltransferase domain-containing protein [candidate division KSB1 bacterium]
MGNSRCIFSNQESVHKKLEAIVQNHATSEYLKPVSDFDMIAFAKVNDQVQKCKCDAIILDSGCGTGFSTLFLAQKYPDCLVIGLDKSMVRLQKTRSKEIPENVVFTRADQFDFWRLVADSNWHVRHHYILYPNPWPKKAHIKRRIYGHPLFVVLPRITNNIEIRSNWLMYVEEFAIAWTILTEKKLVVERIDPQQPISLFEKKFQESGHPLFRLCLQE